MSRLRRTLPIMVFLACLSVDIAPALAQAKPKSESKADRKDEQRENQRVREAQQALDQAQQRQREVVREVTENSRQLNRVEAEKRQAIDKAQRLRKQLEEEQEQRLGLPRLLEEQEQAQKVYDAAAAPVLAALKATAAYLSAVADAKAAHEELKAARAAKPDSAGTEERISVLIRRTLKPGELEKAALEADPKASEARRKLTPVQDKIKAARDKAAAAVESDSGLRAALKNLEQQNAAEDKAKAELARSRGKFATAAARVNQEREQLARATAADRRDDNKPDRPKKKK